MAAEPAPRAAGHPRGRRIATLALIVVGGLLLVVGVLAVWVQRVALETDTWTEVSSELLEQQPVQDALATYVATTVTTEAGVSDRLQERLPPALDPFAGVASVALYQLVERLTQNLLDRPRVQNLWEGANERAHRQLVALIEERDDVALQAQGNTVVLDLRPVLEDVAAQLGPDAQERLAARPDAGVITIMTADQLDTLRTATDLLNTVGVVLLIVVLACFAAAVWIARDRRVAIRDAAIAILLAGLVLVFVRRVLGDEIVDGLVTQDDVRPAADAAWWVVTERLGLANATVLVIGVAALVGAWLAGPGPVATAARGRVAPFLRRRPLVYGTLAALVILLVAWDPVPATHDATTAVILIVLAVLGLEVLRREALRGAPAPPAAAEPALPTTDPAAGGAD